MPEVLIQDRHTPILPAEIAHRLFADARIVTLSDGQILFDTGDPCTGCFQIAEGLVKVTLDSASGRERILAILGPGAMVGELSVLDRTPRSARVTAIRHSKLRFVSSTAFDAFGRAHPDIYRMVAIVLSHRLREINGTLFAESILPAKGRAARTLITLADAFGKNVGDGRIVIRQKVSQRDLAAMAGLARENLSRILQDWMRASVVSRISGYYCLENKAALEREAEPPTGT